MEVSTVVMRCHVVLVEKKIKKHTSHISNVQIKEGFSIT